MRKRLLTLFLLMAGLLNIVAHAAEPATSPVEKVAIPRVEGDVQIDGELQDEFWNRAAKLAPFKQNREGKPASESTEVRIAYNDKGIYLAWTCEDRDIQASYTERDSKLWEEEVVEMFIAPGKPSEYFELQWNPLGTIFDARIQNTLNQDGTSKSIQGDWDYTVEGLQSAVKVWGSVNDPQDRDQRWQVEAFIPFSGLGESVPQPGTLWRANFYRYNRTTGIADPELLSWSQTLRPSFHEPSRFGIIEFVE